MREKPVIVVVPDACERKELPSVKFGSQWRIREEDVRAMFNQRA